MMTKETPKRLIFIYNADSGFRNMLIDGAHKIFSPATYQCSLCDITHGSFSENKIWKKFREESKLQMEFLHKDEFTETYTLKEGQELTFPIILKETAAALTAFVTTKELNALDNPEGLIKLINERV